jgi:hypothetical protein
VVRLHRLKKSIERRTIHDSRSIHAGKSLCVTVDIIFAGESVFKGAGIT